MQSSAVDAGRGQGDKTVAHDQRTQHSAATMLAEGISWSSCLPGSVGELAVVYTGVQRSSGAASSGKGSGSASSVACGASSLLAYTCAAGRATWRVGPGMLGEQW